MAFLERRKLLVDGAIAVGVLVFSLAVLSSGNFDHFNRELDVWGVILAALTSLPLVARRIAPLLVLAVVTGATATLYGFDYGLGPPIGFAIALFTVAENRDEARPGVRKLILALSIVVLFAPHLVTGGFEPELLLGGAVWPATAPGCGASGWQSSRSARCGPSRRPSASAAWLRPRSARASPGTSTTRPATRSTSSSYRRAPHGCSRTRTSSARGRRSRRSRTSPATRSARSTS
jgi:hypothetical protein